MRGSVYYQTSLLTKAIFKEGTKKHQRVDAKHPYYQYVSSYQTMRTYRKVWDNLGNYLKEHWKLKDMEQITAEHIHAYISYKIEYYPSKQYLEKIVSALGKLEWALRYLCRDLYGEERVYRFDIRSQLLHYARVQNLVADGYHDRTYHRASSIIAHLQHPEHELAANIQLYGGARAEGVTLIRPEQLMGMQRDTVTQKVCGAILTKEKGGKEGIILIPMALYQELEKYCEKELYFRIDYAAYAADIRRACLLAQEQPEGTHGFRWTFARNRMRTYQKAGYSYEQALQGVSWEMKHFRADITEHYLGG